MIVFVSLKKLVYTFLWVIAAMALYVFYQSIGLNMFFMIVAGLLALKFAPALFLPILLIAVGVHFTDGFSFIADILEFGIIAIVGIPFILVSWVFIGEVMAVFKKYKNERL